MKKLNLIVALLLTIAVAMPISTSFAAAKSTSKSAEILSEKININTATAQDLTAVPGIGPSKAEKIVSYRSEKGKFTAIEDLMGVKGIGEKSLNKLKKYLTL